MQKALFLDRDGVINKERGQYTWRIEDCELTTGLIPFLKTAQEKGYLLIVISNQGGVAKKKYTMTDVDKLHRYISLQLETAGIHFTDIYYCPHYDGLEKCLCRKPGTLLFEKAIAQYHIDRNRSLFIGDSLRDEEAGKRAGIPTLKITSNEDLTHYLSMLQ